MFLFNTLLCDILLSPMRRWVTELITHLVLSGYQNSGTSERILIVLFNPERMTT